MISVRGQVSGYHNEQCQLSDCVHFSRDTKKLKAMNTVTRVFLTSYLILCGLTGEPIISCELRA